MLLSIIYLYNDTGSTDLAVLLSQDIDFSTQKLIFLAFLASFAVKIPKFPFHI
jgi:NADH-quinone oxidoreductase subunit M